MRRRTGVRLRQALAMMSWRVLAPLALLLAVRLVWGVEAERRFTAEETRLREAGVMPAAEDYLGPAIPDDANAVVPVLAALRNVKPSLEARQVFGMANLSQPETTTHLTAAQAAAQDRGLVAMKPIFAELGDAAARPGARWPAALADPRDPARELGKGVLLPGGPYLAEIARLAARRAHEMGNDDEAFGHLMQALTVARVLDANPLIMMHRAAVRIRTDVATAAEQLLPTADFSDRTAASAGALMQALGTTRDFQKAQGRSYRYQAAVIPGVLEQWSPQLGSWLLRPLRRDDVGRSLEELAAKFPAADSATYDQRLIPRLRPFALVDSNAARIATQLSGDDYDFRRWLEEHADALTDSRAVALLLAARLFALQRHREAANIQELAALLPEPPVDPFARDGAWLHYRVEASGGATVWSVGSNHVDDHGLLPRRRYYDWQERYQQPDLIYGAAWAARFDTPAAPLNAASTTRPEPSSRRSPSPPGR